MNQELEDIVRGAFKAVDNADLKAFFNMMADDIEQVDELTKKWSRGKANVVAALTPSVWPPVCNTQTGHGRGD